MNHYLLASLLVGGLGLQAASAFAPCLCVTQSAGNHLLLQSWTFAIAESFPAPTTASDGEEKGVAILEYLMSHQAFPTASQARRAIHYGEILVLARDEDYDPRKVYDQKIENSMKVTSEHQIIRVTRLPSLHCFPVEITKYIFPPQLLLSCKWTRKDLVLYENDEMAVVHKPESITTIKTSPKNRANAQDLQSLLPFVLSPPAQPPQKESDARIGLPRPVHRLDRGTSGLVIIAKTSSAMCRFSKLFAHREIRKTYMAVVFGGDHIGADHVVNGVIDYPIDGKPAVTKWKLLQTNGNFSLLEMQPKTGRYHQLRRHLAYCLRTPIVGDHKYDLVGTKDSSTITTHSICSSFRKSFRDQGLYLCCHKVEFVYPKDSETKRKKVDSTVSPPCCASSDSTYSYTIVPQCDESGAKQMCITLNLPRKFRTIFNQTSEAVESSS